MRCLLLLTSRLYQEDVFIAIAIFLRHAIQHEIEAGGEVQHVSEVATTVQRFNALLRQSTLPPKLLFFLDETAWYYLQHQPPTNSVLYNEILHLRIVRIASSPDV